MALKYWVGNTGNWASASHWSNTSGGEGGVGRPSTIDTAVFDVNSFTLSDQVVGIFMYEEVGSIETAGCLYNPTFSALGTSDLYIASSCHITNEVTFENVGIYTNWVDAPIHVFFEAVISGVVMLTAHWSDIYLENGATFYAIKITNSGVTIHTQGHDIITNWIHLLDGTTLELGTSTITLATTPGSPYPTPDFSCEGSGDRYINGGYFDSAPGVTFSLTDTTITGSWAGGGASWRALTSAGNVNGGGNKGWNFTTPVSSKTMYVRSIEDTFGAADAIKNIYEIIQDLIHFTEDIPTYFEDVSDSIGISETPYFFIRVPWVMNESLQFSETPSYILCLLTSDGLFAYDTSAAGWHKLVPESITATDSVASILYILASEWLTLIDLQTNNWTGVEVVPEALNLYDLTKGVQQYSRSIDESLVTTDVISYQLAVAVLDLLGFTDLSAAMKSFTETVAESAILTDAPSRGFDKAIEETLSAVDVASIVAVFVKSIEESFGAADAASLIGRLGASVTDPLTLTETITSQGTFYSAVYETLRMNIIVEMGGEVWECFVLNTPKFHPSMYSGFQFNSFCVFENRAFGANETGVYELTGDTDAGTAIHTGAILSGTNFGSSSQKRFRRGYLGISGTAPVMVFETENGQRETYAINSEGKVVASSELKGKNWTLSIADFDTLDSAKLIPVILTK